MEYRQTISRTEKKPIPRLNNTRDSLKFWSRIPKNYNSFMHPTASTFMSRQRRRTLICLTKLCGICGVPESVPSHFNEQAYETRGFCSILIVPAQPTKILLIHLHIHTHSHWHTKPNTQRKAKEFELSVCSLSVLCFHLSEYVRFCVYLTVYESIFVENDGQRGVYENKIRLNDDYISPVAI